MIGFFPTPYPDELLYSVCARYSNRAGFPNKRTVVEELFGSKSFSAVADIPNRLDFFMSALPPNTFTCDEFINENTLFPFYEPFLSSERAAQIRSEIKFSKENRLRMRLGLNIPQVKTPEYLRFCPACAEEDRREYGENYWHRLHQCAGVLVCPKHKCFLQNSFIGFERQSSYNFYSADESLRSLSKKFIVESDPEHQLLLFLATSAEWLLSRTDLCLEEGSLRQRYHNLLLKRGYAYYNGRMKNGKVFEDFNSYYTIPLLENLECVPTSPQRSWLAKILEPNKSHVIHHPVRHLLLMNFLGVSAEEFFTGFVEYEPFGRGPYPCLNKASEHYGEMKIQNCEVKDNLVKNRREKPLGIFSCECGYIYQRVGPDCSESDRFKYSSIRKYGLIWERKLTEMWNDLSLSVAEIARALQVSALTVVRRARILGLPMNSGNSRKVQGYDRHNHPNKTFDQSLVKHRAILLETIDKFPELSRQQLMDKANTSYLWLRRNDSVWLEEHLPVNTVRNRKGDIYDWREIDETLSKEVENVCKRILNEHPIRRVSITEIIKRTGRKNWLEKRKFKLPKTDAVIDKYLETLECFMSRKIKTMEAIFQDRNIGTTKNQFTTTAGLGNSTCRASPRLQQEISAAVERINSQFS